jgi:hypothetical protein
VIFIKDTGWLNMENNNIGLMGEYRVVSELLKQGYNATITFGNAKATDIIILQKREFIRIEVKTCLNGKKFVTSFFPKYTDPAKTHPDFWVFFLPDFSGKNDRFFILQHDEVKTLQLIVNKGNKTLSGQGCDNIPLKLLEEKKTILRIVGVK